MGLPSMGSLGRSPGSLLGHAVVRTTGFFVLGRDLYDRQGARSSSAVNKMSVFDNDDPLGLVSFPEIKQLARTRPDRLGDHHNLQPGGPATSTATLDALIKNAKAHHLIPMIELHDATGDWGRVDELVNYWTQPAVVSTIRNTRLICWSTSGMKWETTRSARPISSPDTLTPCSGSERPIHTPLVIDAPDWGKDLGMLNNTAATLLAADPDGNLMLSVHLYWSMSCGANAAFIRSNLQPAADLSYPLMVGEFSQYGGFPCSNPTASICSPAAEIDYRTILAACHELQLGWYAWEWGPGNDFNDPLCAVMDMTPDRLFAHLKPGWAHEVGDFQPVRHSTDVGYACLGLRGSI